MAIQTGPARVSRPAAHPILHNHDLIDDELLTRLVGKVHLFDGDLGARTLLAEDVTGNTNGGLLNLRDVDRSGSTLSDLLLL